METVESQGSVLWDVLKEKYGFKQHVFYVPINKYQQFREDLLPRFWLKLFPVVKKETSSDDWLSTTINDNFYEVAMVDLWYVSLRKNGVEIFDKRRFENEEFLKLLI
jgi:hypothetical protein